MMSHATPAVVMGDLALIRPLAMAKIPFVLVTDHADAAALHSRHVHEALVVPGYGRKMATRTLTRLLALAEQIRREYGHKPPLFYGDDEQLGFIYANRAALETHYALLLNEPEIGRALYDKSQFYPLCERVGIRAPRTLAPGDELTRLREPILVKPKRKPEPEGLREAFFGGAAKARIFATRAELEAHPAWPAARDELVVQEYVEGAVEDLCSFHGFADESHRLLAGFCGRKLRTYPALGGESSFIELVEDEEVERVGREIVRGLGLKGPFKIDLLRDTHSGVLWTLEINARYTLWDYLGAMNGLNVLEIAYDHLVEHRQPSNAGGVRAYRRWLSLYRDAHAYREQHRLGLLGLGEWLRSIASPSSVYEVFAWDDPLPFVFWMRNFLRPKLRRRDGSIDLGEADR
jgi:predicted ATP-grasp superfamily ATP-dependent carboligase